MICMAYSRRESEFYRMGYLHLMTLRNDLFTRTFISEGF